MRIMLICGALVALAACQKPGQQNTVANEAASTEQAGPVKGVDRSHASKPAPDSTFKDPNGEDTTLAGFSLKPARRNQADQPPIDSRQAQRDQCQPTEILRRERLVEKKRSEQDGDRRHEKGHEQRIGRAGSLDQAEVEHVAEGGAEECKRD